MPTIMMKAAFLIPLLSIPALASPAFQSQFVLDDLTRYGALVDSPDNVLLTAETLFDTIDQIQEWFHEGKQFVQQNGLIYELLTHPLFSDYRVRIAQPNICDPSVKQYSGYLDITTGKHFFFWFFESRNSPETADFIYWTNGGPGCSSITGLLFELGPCRIANNGTNTTYNKFSWNEHANILFLDQPIDAGYSYSDDGSKTDRSYAAGEDVYAFYQLFFARFPEYASAKFHMAAESYGGTLTPNAASIFHKKNKALELSPIAGLTRINLASVILANGITDALRQFPSVPDFACNGPYPIYDDPEGLQCTALRNKVSTCQRLTQACYNFDSKFTCVPAQLYCWGQLLGPFQLTGLNVYDVRKKCDRSTEGNLCYRQLLWVENWMNDRGNKAALGVNPALTYQSCNFEVYLAFTLQGDAMRNSAALLSALVNDGIRLLVYAGNADAMCNFMGQERWVADFANKFHEEFQDSVFTPWVAANTGKVAGEVRSAGGGGFTAGNVTLVTVYEAGHMVPYDQPEAASDLIRRWIADIPITN